MNYPLKPLMQKFKLYIENVGFLEFLMLFELVMLSAKKYIFFYFQKLLMYLENNHGKTHKLFFDSQSEHQLMK